MFNRLSSGLVKRPLVAFLLIAMGILLPAAVAQAIITESPRRDTPIVLDGEVWAVEEVGQTIVVGGNFTQVQTTRDGPVVDQPAIFAYDRETGQFIDDFRPVLISNGNVPEIRDLQATPDGTGVYIGGRFDAIDDLSDGQSRVRNRLALLSVANGYLDRTFAQGGVDAKVLSLELSNGYLYAGGNFTNVYDLAPGQPLTTQSVNGLSRFDATTGEYDDSFRFESQDNIGRIINGSRFGGVSRVAMNPAGTRLVVAHRGARMLDANTGTNVQAGGIAVIAIAGNQSASLTNFEALYPDPADPIQTMYHAGQCNNRGVQIRDLEISPDGTWFALTAQGADLGYQCDTITRFELTTAPTRPTWVARGFDSVFSLGIDDDAVYVGGHFRYLVHPSAPSTYPGLNGANGDPSPTGEWYYADPDATWASAVNFQNDLLNPGYVFRAEQIGALDPNTGYGIPTYTPTSDAGLGVLELTVIDRGLLLGQDNGRINDEFVGRSAFFDIDPDAADPRCSVTINGDDHPVLSWTDTGNVNTWNVAADDTFIGSTSANSFVDEVTEGDKIVAYELRFTRNGFSLIEDCGSIYVPPAPIISASCTSTIVNGDTVRVSWNNEDWTRVAVRRGSTFLTSVDTGATSYEYQPGPGTHFFSIRAFQGDVRYDADCGSVTIADTSDTTAPVVTLTSSTTPNTGTHTLSGTVTDDASGVDRVRVLIRNQQSGEYWNGTTWQTAWTWNLATINGNTWSYPNANLDTAGTYSVTLWAWDNNNNRERPPATILTVATSDTTAPVVTLTSSTTPNTGTYTLSGTVTDDASGVDRVRVLIRNQQSGEYWNGTTWQTAWTWNLATINGNTWSYPNANLDTAGTYSVTLWAWDNNNNRERPPATILTVATSDTTAPVVTLTSSTTPNTGTHTLSGTVTDDASGVDRVRVLIRNQQSGEYWNGTTWQTAWTWNLATINGNTWSYPNANLDTAGTYSVTLWAWDNNNNRERPPATILTVN